MNIKQYLPQKLCQSILVILTTQTLISYTLPPPSRIQRTTPNREKRQDSLGIQLKISQECPLNFIDCDNGRCVKFELVNDGKNDCGNGKDESYQDCPINQFKCHNSTKCLKYDFICDGHALTDSCPGRSDEQSCHCPRVLCKGHCVPKGWTGCEGYPECLRKEDELLCLKDDQGHKVLSSGKEILADSPSTSSGLNNTKVNLSVEEVINNSLSLLSLSSTSSTQDNYLKSLVSSTTTLSPQYHYPSSNFDDMRRPQDNSGAINYGGDKVTISRTDLIRRRNGEEEEKSNVLISDKTVSPEALSPVDSVINFFSSTSSTQTYPMLTIIILMLHTSIQFIVQFK